MLTPEEQKAAKGRQISYSAHHMDGPQYIVIDQEMYEIDDGEIEPLLPRRLLWALWALCALVVAFVAVGVATLVVAL